jgi:hypothetical protein
MIFPDILQTGPVVQTRTHKPRYRSADLPRGAAHDFGVWRKFVMLVTILHMNRKILRSRNSALTPRLVVVAFFLAHSAVLAGPSKADLVAHMGGSSPKGQTLKTVAYEMTVLVRWVAGERSASHMTPPDPCRSRQTTGE